MSGTFNIFGSQDLIDAKLCIWKIGNDNYVLSKTQAIIITTSEGSALVVEEDTSS